MARKILTYILIILGCGLLFCVGTVVVLFLAPGTEIFGIRYVAPNQGVFVLAEKDEVMDSFSGDIYIESNEIPINIKYSLIYNVEVEYKQDFIGLTMTKNKFPILEYKVENNNLYLKSKDLVKFIYARETYSNDHAYFNIYLPSSFANRSIYINSNNSEINFNAGSNSTFKELKIKTDSNINISGNVNAGVIDFSTRQALEIKENINANHFKLKSGTNNIKVNRDVSGTLEVDAGSSTLLMKNAGKLIFKSTSGGIKPIVDNTNISIGTASIETHSGTLNIENITSAEESVVKSTSGIINIGSAINLNVVNDRGPININKVNVAKITGGLGTINVNQVLTSINIESKNGSVNLGKDNFEINNPIVNTTTGKIVVRNACGNINLVSKNDEIDVVGKSISSIKIDAGDRVKAYKLAGDIEIIANDEIDMQVETLSGNISVKAKDGCKKVVLDIKKYILNDFNYNFKSTKARTVTLQEGEKVTKQGKSEEKRTPSIAGLFEVKIETTYADMFIFTK